MRLEPGGPEAELPRQVSGLDTSVSSLSSISGLITLVSVLESDIFDLSLRGLHEDIDLSRGPLPQGSGEPESWLWHEALPICLPTALSFSLFAPLLPGAQRQV